jgi:hypothetical protein
VLHLRHDLEEPGTCCGAIFWDFCDRNGNCAGSQTQLNDASDFGTFDNSESGLATDWKPGYDWLFARGVTGVWA